MMRNVRRLMVIASVVATTACSNEAGQDMTAPQASAAPLRSQATATSATPASWKLPLNGSGLGLTSDGLQSDGTYSVYDDGVCGVSGAILTNGSGDATLQTNNPTAKQKGCAARKMTVVYPAGDVAYPNGGTETMLVFLNAHNISNSTTKIPVGYAYRVERQLSLNPTQRERCDAWRWSSVQVAGDNVWVERMTSTTFHVYTKDRDPDSVAASANVGNNKAVCTTTGQAHHLSVDLYIVARQALP